MNWQAWADELRHHPEQAVTDLLRGAASIAPFERISPHEFLMAVMPVEARIIRRNLLGEPRNDAAIPHIYKDFQELLDTGLCRWLETQQQLPLPQARKLSAYAAQVSEALQWPLFFNLEKTRTLLMSGRPEWLKWLSSLTLSTYLDPEYDYWQVLATYQADDRLQFFWQSFVNEARRTRSSRYLNLGLLALARLPLCADDSLRNLRLQVQALIGRYQRRRGLGNHSLQEFARNLTGVMARNPSLSEENYRIFLSELLLPLGEDTALSVLGSLGFKIKSSYQVDGQVSYKTTYRLQPPSNTEDTNRTLAEIRISSGLVKAWTILCREIKSQEEYLHKSGDAYHFVRVLDRCVRALCEKYTITDPEILPRLFQWIHLSLRLEPEEPRRWMLWELVLRKAKQPQRAKWVLWEMTRRFPDNLPCRVDLARLLIESDMAVERKQASSLLNQVLELDPDNLHAIATLATLAIRYEDWSQVLMYAQKGLHIDATDSVCALLLANAYVQRNEPDDRKTAIEFLTRFTSQYSPQTQAEKFLHKLRNKKDVSLPENLIATSDKNSANNVSHSIIETDTAWLAFADTLPAFDNELSTQVTESSERSIPGGRTFPLPQALQRVVSERDWGSDLLDLYEKEDREEFPLETTLWRYLQIRNLSSSTDFEKEKARMAVEERINFEGESESEGSSYLRYLQKEWARVNADAALDAGAEWLEVLLERYQPLPAPLFA